ncbi:unnamed protein product [Caenorhabditis auriculariae]|uniref:non-specific protein-tyrosine kinase n=1 Tax=Caenorhabditis auriculariae TaxID=2777116 RepID=A0A8S1HF61_9PELO|nr:unnamed protein product [Caenorhabditis auriculariae]
MRLRSGAESHTTTMQEQTGSEQLNGSHEVKKPGPVGYEDVGFDAGQTEKDGIKDGQKTSLIDKLMSDGGNTKKSIMMDQEQTQVAEDFAGRLESRARADIHQFIVPQRLEMVQKAPKDPEEFLKSFCYFHGFLPEFETRRFLRRAGDFLVRKTEEEGELFTLISVGVMLDHKRDMSESLGENYGKDEPIRIMDYAVRRVEKGISIEHEHVFVCLKDLLIFYMLNPRKLSLNIQLKRGCPTRVFQFRERHISRLKTLGSGNFGEVYLANVNSFGMIGQKAAVKSLKKDSPNFSERSESFMEEARLMLTLHHPHVVKTFGWMLDVQPFMIVMEYMEGGSLETYLLKSSEEPNVALLLKYGLEAAEGLAYLHQINIIHRDVAARNCLLTADHKLKLGDFGLAVPGPLYYMLKGETLPTRYLSPETLAIFLFLHASDTFAFGNLLFEIFSNGLMPFENLTSAEARQKIMEGELNDLEDTCAPPPLRQFINENLWTYEMKSRAQMDKVVAFLKKTYRELKREQGGPKTGTIETEEITGKDEAGLPKKGKLRRRVPPKRQELMEELCPTQENSTNIE